VLDDGDEGIEVEPSRYLNRGHNDHEKNDEVDSVMNEPIAETFPRREGNFLFGDPFAGPSRGSDGDFLVKRSNGLIVGFQIVELFFDWGDFDFFLGLGVSDKSLNAVGFEVQIVGEFSRDFLVRNF